MKQSGSKKGKTLGWMVMVVALLFSGCAGIQPTAKYQPGDRSAVSEEVTKVAPVQWTLGTATPSEECGVCHQAIYREYAMGFGSDLKFTGIVYKSVQDKLLTLPSNVSTSGTAHSLAGVDPFPVHARGMEEEGRSCDVCHFPEAFKIVDIEEPTIAKPVARPKDQESIGLTCASCHLTPEGAIRGPHDVNAPHRTVQNLRMQTSDMCA